MRRRWSFIAVLFGGSTLACAQGELYKQKAERLAEDVARKATTPAMPCDAEVDDSEASACVSGKLWCGATVEGTTKNGHDDWDGEFYNEKFCFPGGNYNGPERVYTLDVPAYTSAIVDLQSDCVDLDLVALAFTWSSGRCPGPQHSIPNCDGKQGGGGGTIELQTFNNPGSYLIAVDGAEEGTFRISVRCQDIARR